MKVLNKTEAQGEFKHMWNAWWPVAGAVAHYFLMGKDPDNIEQPELMQISLGYVLKGMVERNDAGEKLRVAPIEKYLVPGSIELESQEDREKAEAIKSFAIEANEKLEDLEAACCNGVPQNGKYGNKTLIIPATDKPAIDVIMSDLREICSQAVMLHYSTQECKTFEGYSCTPRPPKPQRGANVTKSENKPRLG